MRITRKKCWPSPRPRINEGQVPAPNYPRNGKCPQRYWFCDSAKRYVPQSIRARNQEGAEAAAVPDPQGTAGAVSGAPAEVPHASQAVFPTLEATCPSWRVLAEDCFGVRHTIRECRGHGPCSNARLDRHHLHVCCGLFHVPCPARARNYQSAAEN